MMCNPKDNFSIIIIFNNKKVEVLRDQIISYRDFDLWVRQRFDLGNSQISYQTKIKNENGELENKGYFHHFL